MAQPYQGRGFISRFGGCKIPVPASREFDQESVAFIEVWRRRQPGLRWLTHIYSLYFPSITGKMIGTKKIGVNFHFAPEIVQRPQGLQSEKFAGQKPDCGSQSPEKQNENQRSRMNSEAGRPREDKPDHWCRAVFAEKP